MVTHYVPPPSSHHNTSDLAATPEWFSAAAAREAEGPDSVPTLTPDCILAKTPRGKRLGHEPYPWLINRITY